MSTKSKDKKKDDKNKKDDKKDKKEDKKRKSTLKKKKDDDSEGDKKKNTKSSSKKKDSEESEKKKKTDSEESDSPKKKETKKDDKKKKDEPKKDDKKDKKEKVVEKKKDDGKKEELVFQPGTKKSVEEMRKYYRKFISKSKKGTLNSDDFESFKAFANDIHPEQKDQWNKVILDHAQHNHFTQYKVKNVPVNNTVNVVDNPEDSESSHEGGTMQNNDKITDTKDSTIWNNLKKGARKEWSCQTKFQVCQPLYIYKPTTLFGDNESSVEFILKHALLNDCKVKPFGDGHSYSDIAVTTDFLMDTHGLNKVCSNKGDIAGQLSPDVLKEGHLPYGDRDMKKTWDDYNPEKNRALLEMECGVRLIDLNKVIDDRNLGLMNMGGYDHQTIMGVISTSTHGSGIHIGPFCDMVKSLVIATTGTWDGKGIDHDSHDVNFYRIEPSNGITDPEKYKNDKIQLIQDDECFYAVACNIGCFGIVYSVVIEVMQKYWLREDRQPFTLTEVLEKLKPNPDNEGHIPDLLRDYRNCEILVHPYPMDDGKEVHEFDPKEVDTIYDKIECLVTMRNIVERPNNLFGRKGHRDCLTSFVQQFGCTFEAGVALINSAPLMIPWAISQTYKTLEDKDYVNVSHEIYVLGLNGDAGFACEIGYNIEDNDGNYTDAEIRTILNRIFIIAQKARLNGFQFQTSPFSLRFVQKSPCYMSMMYNRTTMMIEFDMLTGTLGGYEVMRRTEAEISYDLGGRPHWGLDFDWINGNIGIERLYPKYNIWKKYYDNFNAKGTFNNQFTNRMGFWQYKVPPPQENEE